MWLRVSCNLKFYILTPLPFVLMLRPRSGTQLRLAAEEYRHNPNTTVQEFTSLDIGGRWYNFDAINSKFGGPYVAVDYGNDAADVALYKQYGPVIYPHTKHLETTALTLTEPKLISSRV